MYYNSKGSGSDYVLTLSLITRYLCYYFEFKSVDLLFHLYNVKRYRPNFSVKQTFAVKILVMFSYKILNIKYNLVGISKQGFKHKQ